MDKKPAVTLVRAMNGYTVTLMKGVIVLNVPNPDEEKVIRVRVGACIKESTATAMLDIADVTVRQAA